jgi:FtsP/CotA-like multicopper oxidase with cupredoxin domain
VHVHNSLDGGEGVSVHWHGLTMNGFNNMDGAVGFTQCAILPGQNFTYELRIDDRRHGTFWYHAHSQEQRGDGLYGGLVVHRPDENGVSDLVRFGYEKEMLLLVGDWFHRSAEEILAWFMSTRAFGNEVMTCRRGR